MPGYPTDFDRCGFGTGMGCGSFVYSDAHIVTNGRRVAWSGGQHTDNGHVLFHRECCPCVVAPERVKAVAE